MRNDFVGELLNLLDATPRDQLERVIRSRWAGTTVYVSAATGRHMVKALVDLGIPRRSAYFKVHGR